MNIGIVTVYESIDNYGSYLQTYAMKRYLEKLGHKVYVIQNRPVSALLKKYVFKLNPKRELFLRFKKGILFLDDNKRLDVIEKEKVGDQHLDFLIYGSDEIWNLQNPYFRDPFFWGGIFAELPKIAFAASVGAMEIPTEEQYAYLFYDLENFCRIMVRDEKTFDFVFRRTGEKPTIVCDPTMLLPVEELTAPLNCPQEPYMVAYTYGVDAQMADLIKWYAAKHGLLVVSACFWHPWADKTVECSPLQLSSLMQGADCVFSSTFHGALFTLYNHKRCCIYPAREKVRNVVSKLGMANKMIAADCSKDHFEEVMQSEFEIDAFEERVAELRAFSKGELEETIRCLE